MGGSRLSQRKSIVRSLLKRDIVPGVARAMTPVGRVAWQSALDGENSFLPLAVRWQPDRLRRARGSRRPRSLRRTGCNRSEQVVAIHRNEWSLLSECATF